MKNISKYIIYTLVLLASIISCSREEEEKQKTQYDEEEIFYYQSLSFSFRDNLGVILSISDFTWKLSDESMGEVDSRGRFTPKKIGQVDVIATHKSTGQVYTTRVKIIAPEFKISPQKKELNYNEEFVYNVETSAPYSSNLNKLFSWNVSDNKIGTIDENGYFKAKKIGNTKITATNTMTKKNYTMDVVVQPMVPDFPLVLDGFGKAKNYIKLNEKRPLTSETENSIVYQTPTNEWGYSIVRKIEYQFENGMLKNIIVNFDPERYNRVEHYYRERYNLLNEDYTYDYTRQSNRYWKNFLDDNNMIIYYQRYEEIRQFTTTEVSVKYSKN